MSEHTEASEQAETPEQTAEQHEHHPAKQSSGSSGPFIALLLAITAIVAVVLLWQQQMATQKDAQALQQGVSKLLTVVEQRHKSLQQQITSHRHPATDAQLEQTTAKLRDIRSRLGLEQHQWFIAEMEYLLRTASHRLTLEHDKETALAALQQARLRLSGQDNNNYQPVLQQVNEDIAKLKAVSFPDRNRIAAEIATLIDAVEHWPFAVRKNHGNKRQAPEKEGVSEQPAPDGQAEAAEKAGQGTGLSQMFDRIWQDFKGLVTIRRNGDVARPLLQPQQRYFLQQNMQLKLQAARLALLAGNDKAYRDSLLEANTWLTNYFDISSLPVSEAKSTIEQLASVDLSPELPSLSKSIALLHQVEMNLRPQTEILPAQPVTSKPTKQTKGDSPKKPTTPLPEQTETKPKETAAPQEQNQPKDLPEPPKGNGQ